MQYLKSVVIHLIVLYELYIIMIIFCLGIIAFLAIFNGISEYIWSTISKSVPFHIVCSALVPAVVTGQ